MYWLSLAAAYIVDLLIGDPVWITHPVILMGKAIEKIEKFLRLRVVPYIGLKAAGVILTLTLVVGSYGVTWLLIYAANSIHPMLGTIVGVWLISTTIASKCLAQSAGEILALLRGGDLSQARVKVGWIVGRDTDQLTSGEVVRATVETVAENIVDGVIAPMFYCLLGGAPLGMAYKAANTLDSMVGYRNEKYLEFGWASARWDDVMNYIPARITAVLLLIASAVLRLEVRNAVLSVIRDAGKHPSPNSGFPEATVAGAMGVQLGGLNYYGGVPSYRALMGEARLPLEAEHIQLTVRLMYLSGLLFVMISFFGYYSFS